MNKTKISWTDVSWNPVHGCSRVSEGCRHCYAEELSLRYKFTTQPWTAANAGVNVQLKPHKLREPYKLKSPSRIFVNSMSDLFHHLVPDEYISRIFDVMEELPQHTFQILTKRAERLASWKRWPTNVWMGVSVEDRLSLDRIALLRACDASLKWISFEPLLESLTDINLEEISWVVVGGESGRGYRSMDPAWARAIRDQCLAAEIPFFFKQSSGPRNEMNPWIMEPDGSCVEYRELPQKEVEQCATP